MILLYHLVVHLPLEVGIAGKTQFAHKANDRGVAYPDLQSEAGCCLKPKRSPMVNQIICDYLIGF